MVNAGQESRWQESAEKAVQTRYRECLLQKVQPSPSALAAEKLHWACQRRYGSERVPGDEEMAYEECLLGYLPQVQNDASAQVMLRLCEEQFAPRAKQEKQDGLGRAWRWLQGEKTAPGMSVPLTIDGDRFEPLQPWQGGQGR
ncbi:MAG: hypothetical protein HQM06_06470 [Magnetococcales bacterium]|nr:hypothetical protein [Magnetococcales bacterium]